jgi:hypothetical protein
MLFEFYKIFQLGVLIEDWKPGLLGNEVARRFLFTMEFKVGWYWKDV